MRELRFTLVADGPSDKRLVPIARWVIQQHTTRPIASTWADFSVLPVAARPRTLHERIRAAAEYFPADLLLVHRDAETETRDTRVREIRGACPDDLSESAVPLVTVRMQEAWLLISEPAIRAAAGNPRGRNRLDLPPVGALESVADPKFLLYQALEEASGLAGRHLSRFNVAAAAYRVSELIEDFSDLRRLQAFVAFEQDLVGTLEANNLR